MRLIYSLLITCVFLTNVSGQENSNMEINQKIRNYTFEITGKTIIGDSTYRTSRSTGFKVRGFDGILTSFHGVLGSNIIEVTDQITNQRYRAKITHVDNDHDVALLQPNVQFVKSSENFKRENGFKVGYLSEEITQRKGFQAYTSALWRVESNVTKYPIKVPEFKFMVGSDELIRGLINEGGNPGRIKQIYSEFDSIIVAYERLFQGHSGAPAFFIDSNEVYVFGLIHGCYGSDRYKASYITPFEIIKLEKYDETKINRYVKWNLENDVVYKQIEYNNIKQPIALIQKITYTQETQARPSIRKMRLFFNFEKEAISILKSDTLPNADDWRYISRKTKKKNKTFGVGLSLFHIIDSLVYTDSGLVKAITEPTDSSEIDLFSNELYSMATDSDKVLLKESEKFYNNYISLLSDEINQLRFTYVKAQMLLDSAQLPNKSLFEVRRNLYKAKFTCMDQSEQIRHSCPSSGVPPPTILNLMRAFDSLSYVAEDQIASLDIEIGNQKLRAKDYFDTLAKKGSPEALLALLDEINRNSKYEHIALLLKEDIEKQRYYAEKKLKDRNRHASLEEINAAISLIYRNLYNEQFIENIEFHPFMQMESQVVNESIQFQFKHGNEIFESDNDLIFQNSVFTDYPRGRSKTTHSNKGALLTAELLGKFLFAVREQLHLDFGIQNYTADVHVIGMSDGYRFKGTYNPRKDYSREELRAFRKNKDLKCTVIKDINCNQHGINLIKNSTNVEYTYRQLDKLDNVSYKNNVKLAYHRALNYWNVMEANMGIRRNVIPHIYACNVPEKGGICRRTEVGVSFGNFPYNNGHKGGLMPFEKKIIIRDFDLALNQ